MAIWYINGATGTDATTSGTAASTPFKTMGYFLVRSGTTQPVLAPGDTVYIAPGIYQETVNFSILGTPTGGLITVIGDVTGVNTNSAPGRVIVDGYVAGGANRDGFILDVDYYNFKNLTFQNCNYAVNYGNSSFVAWENCKFDNCLYGLYGAVTTSFKQAFADCEFTNLYRGYYVTSGAGSGTFAGHPLLSNGSCHYFLRCSFINISDNAILLDETGDATAGYNTPKYPLVVDCFFDMSATYSIYFNYATYQSNSDNSGLFGNMFVGGTQKPILFATRSGSLDYQGNVINKPQQVGTSVVLTFATTAPVASTSGTNHLRPPNTLCYNADSDSPAGAYGAFGLFLEKTSPIQGTASGKLYGFTKNSYKWLIPADLNQSLGVILSARRSWVAGNGGSVTFSLYDEWGQLTPSTVTLADTDALSTVTIPNITMPYKGFAILEASISPRSTGTALGDHVLIDDIQIV